MIPKRRFFSWAALSVLAAASASHAEDLTPINQLSQANRLSILHDYDISAIGLTRSTTTGSPGAFSLLMGRTPDGTDQPFNVSFAPIAGYDSNPEGRRFARSGEFGGGDLSAGYNLNFGKVDPIVGAKTSLTFGYDATGAVYSGQVGAADVFQQTLSADFKHWFFDNTLRIDWLVKDQFTMQHGAAILNTFDAAPTAEIFYLPQASVELGYDYTNLSYYIHTAPRRDPDANRSTFNVRGHLYPTPQKAGPVDESPDVLTDILRDALQRFTIGYDHVWNDSAASDWVYQSNRLYVGVDGLGYARAKWLTLDVEYAHEFQNYLNPNTEGPTVLAGRPKAIRRHDGLDIVTLRANAKLWDFKRNYGSLSTFLQWDVIQDHSNIIPRHFNEFIISGGLQYQY